MKTKLVIRFCVLAAFVVAIVYTSHPAEPPKPTPTPTSPPVKGAPLFRTGEVQLDLNGTATGHTFDDVKYGGGVGLNYYPWRNIGFGVDAQTEDTASAFIDRLGASAILRFPIESLRLAPEVRGGYQFDFERGDGSPGRDGHELYTGAGAEFRLTKNWGIGAEVRHVWPTDDRTENYLMGILRIRRNF